MVAATPGLSRTMPSSPRPLSSCQQATKISKDSACNDKRYHQTIYDDGHQRYIVEARPSNRRPRGISAKRYGPSHRCLVLDSNDTMQPKRLSSNSSMGSPSTKMSSLAGRAALAPSRDGRDKESPIKASAIVVGPAAQYLKAAEIERRSRPQRWEEPTPPPTPRLDRLSSPELSDLDEAPFCECDEATVVSYCTSCKKPVVLL